MHQQRNPDAPSGDSDHLQRALLDLVVHDHPGLWSLAELDRALHPEGPDAERAWATEDLVADLYAAGLIHRHGPFIFATRAATAADRIPS